MHKRRYDATRVLSVAMVVIGLAMIIQTMVRGDFAFLRLLLGALFIAAGFGRLYLQRQG
ncbi:MAG: hypothetical protein ACR2K9_07315 [Solirubrobacteraceae bacterium]